MSATWTIESRQGINTVFESKAEFDPITVILPDRTAKFVESGTWNQPLPEGLSDAPPADLPRAPGRPMAAGIRQR